MQLEYLVKWKDYLFYKNSWEPAEHLINILELLDKYNTTIIELDKIITPKRMH